MNLGMMNQIPQITQYAPLIMAGAIYGAGLILFTLLKLGSFAKSFNAPTDTRFTRFYAAYCLPITLAFEPIKWTLGFIYRHCVPEYIDRRIDRISSKMLDKLMTRYFQSTVITDDTDLLLVGGEHNINQYARKNFDPDKFEFLYKNDIDADLIRSPVIHGRLANGWPVTFLAWQHAKIEDIATIFRDSLKAGARVGSLVTILMIALTILATQKIMPYPFPGFSFDILNIAAWCTDYTLNIAILGVYAIIPGLLFALSTAYATFASRWKTFFEETTSNLKTATIDSYVNYRYFYAQRVLDIRGHNQRIRQSERLRGDPIIKLGISTGHMSMMGFWSYSIGQDISIDVEGLLRHTCIFGPSGSQKTRLMVKQLAERIPLAFAAAGKKLCCYYSDGKGVFTSTESIVMQYLIDSGRLPPHYRVICIGPGEHEYGLDIFNGLAPTQIAEMFRDVCEGGSAKDAEFWVGSATTVVLCAAVLGYVIEHHFPNWEDDDTWSSFTPTSPLGIDHIIKMSKERKARLIGVKLQSDESDKEEVDEPQEWTVRRVLEEKFLNADHGLIEAVTSDDMIAAVDQTVISGEYGKVDYKFGNQEEPLNAKMIESAITFWIESFPKFSDATSASFMAYIDNTFKPMSVAPKELKLKFCTGKHQQNFDMHDIFQDGVMVFENISEKYGNAGKTIKRSLSKRLDDAIKLRMETDLPACKELRMNKLFDEGHFLLGKSDIKNISIIREGGVMFSFATQTFTALAEVLGEGGAKAIIANTQNRILLSADDESTSNIILQGCPQTLRGINPRPNLEDNQYIRELELPDTHIPYISIPNRSASILPPIPGTDTKMRQAQAFDGRFIPTEMNGKERDGREMAIMSAVKEATWRQEDQHNLAVSNNRTLAPAITRDDMRHGNGIAAIKIVRGSEVSIDLAILEMDTYD